MFDTATLKTVIDTTEKTVTGATQWITVDQIRKPLETLNKAHFELVRAQLDAAEKFGQTLSKFAKAA